MNAAPESAPVPVSPTDPAPTGTRDRQNVSIDELIAEITRTAERRRGLYLTGARVQQLAELLAPSTDTGPTT